VAPSIEKDGGGDPSLPAITGSGKPWATFSGDAVMNAAGWRAAFYVEGEYRNRGTQLLCCDRGEASGQETPALTERVGVALSFVCSSIGTPV